MHVKACHAHADSSNAHACRQQRTNESFSSLKCVPRVPLRAIAHEITLKAQLSLRYSRDVNRPSTVADRCRAPPRSACESTTALPAGRVCLRLLSDSLLSACAAVPGLAWHLAFCSSSARCARSGRPHDTSTAACATSATTRSSTPHRIHQPQSLPLRHLSSSMATSFTRTCRPSAAG